MYRGPIASPIDRGTSGWPDGTDDVLLSNGEMGRCGTELSLAGVAVLLIGCSKTDCGGDTGPADAQEGALKLPLGCIMKLPLAMRSSKLLRGAETEDEAENALRGAMGSVISNGGTDSVTGEKVSDFCDFRPGLALRGRGGFIELCRFIAGDRIGEDDKICSLGCCGSPADGCEIREPECLGEMPPPDDTAGDNLTG